MVTLPTLVCDSMHEVLPAREAHLVSRVFIGASLRRHDGLIPLVAELSL